MQIFSHIFCIFFAFLLFFAYFRAILHPNYHEKHEKKHYLSAVLIPLEVIHHLLQVLFVLLGDVGCCRLLFLPCELVEVLRRLGRGVLLAVVEHARQEPLQGAGVLPRRMVAAMEPGKVAVHLPPLHAVQEVIGCDSALSDYDLIELEGGYAFFAASSLGFWSADLSG